LQDDRSDALNRLACEAARGDHDALEALLNESRTRLQRYFRSRARTPDDAEDLVQETLLRVANYLPNTQLNAPYEHWLYRIAANCLATYYSRAYRHAETPFTQLENPDGVLDLQQESFEASLLERIADEQTQAQLYAIVQQVCSDAERRVLWLHAQHERLEDIAQMLGMNAATVRSHLMRGRAKVLAYLVQHRRDWLGGDDAVQRAIERLDARRRTAQRRRTTRPERRNAQSGRPAPRRAETGKVPANRMSNARSNSHESESGGDDAPERRGRRDASERGADLWNWSSADRRCDRYDEYIDHITLCPVCRETYKQLLRAEAVVREARRPRVALPRLVAPLAAAAAVLALVFIGRALLLPTAPETLALRQQDGVWYEGATRLPEWASTAAALFANPPDAPTRSDAAPAQRAVRLLAPNPANRALESLTPEFRWQAVSDAARYRARLERADTGEPVPLVVEGTQARLASNTMLQAGVRYRLTIEALATGEVAGEGLTGVYEFRTLTPDEQTRLRWARANRPNAPRTCVACSTNSAATPTRGRR
jgi:RNA polymerase sigma-70 factor (ECF subfamily)